MNEVEYILRVILKARNDLGRAFAAARTQLEAFVASAKKADGDLDNLNKRISSMNTRIGNSTKKVQEWQSAIRAFSGDLDKADKASTKSAKSIEAIGKESDTAAKKMVVQKRASEDLHKSTKELGDSFVKVAEDIKKGGRDRDDYVKDLKRIASEYDKLEKKTKFGSDQQQSFRQAGNAARGLLKDLDDLTKKEEKYSASAKKGHETRRANLAADKARAATAAALTKRIAEVESAERKLTSELRRGTISQTEHRAEAQRISAAYRKLAGEFDLGSAQARKFGVDAERLRTRIATLGRETRTTRTRVDGLNKSFSEGSRHASHYGGSVAQLDNNLRGLGLLAAFAASQQLITGLIGLGGQFVAVASSAAMAGTAIGGGVVAGVAQALPAVGLLTAAMVRVKTVMDAVNQAQLLQKRNFVQGEKATRAQADGIDAITNAQDGLRSAHEHVAEAQDGVTEAQNRATEATKKVSEAQKDARRELEDMILAQKEASLAAKGAALSEEEARAALAKAIATGGDVRQAQLGVAEAHLRVTSTARDARRATADTGAAVRGGVQGMPGVVAARKDAEDAEKAIGKAQKAAEDAAQGVAKATRGIETARRNAAEAVAGTQTAQAQLDFMLSQLSPAERKLYEAVTRFQQLFRTTYRGITDDIIGAFTHATNRATEILKQPQVLAEARKLSREIGKSFRTITDAFTSQPMVDQFLRITEAGRKNLSPLTRIIVNLGKAFANIAEAAGPALGTFIGFVGDLAGKFERLTGQRGKLIDFFDEGEKHLEAWVTLGLSIINFFAALAGAGGADSGLKSVQDATKAIDGLTDKIRDNSEKVRQFFEDARGVTNDVIGVVIALGKELFTAFSPDHLHGLAEFLKQTAIPALGDIIKVVSAVSGIFLTIASVPGIDQAVKLLIELAAFAMVAGSTASGFKKVGDQVLYLKDGAVAARSAALRAGPALADFGKRLSLGAQFGEAAGQGGKLTGVMARLGPIFTRAGAVVRVATATMFGPWGLAAAAVITGIILLDKKFHFLGPTLKWLKGAFADVFDWLKHHWPLVLTILTGPFGLAVTLIVKHWDKIKGAARRAFGFLKDVVGEIGDFIGGHGGGPVGRALSKVLRFILKWSPAGVLLRIGKEMWHGLHSGFVTSILNFFKDIGTWLFNHVIKPIYEFFEIKSPSGYFSRIGKMLVDGLVDGFKNLPNALLKALEGMGKLLMDVGGKIGEWIRKGLEKVPGGKLILGAAGKVKSLLSFAEGGPVPGSGGGDIVPALLTPGEHVWTAAEVRAAGGHGALYAMRAFFGGGTQASGPRMAEGGYPIPRAQGQSGLQDPQSPAIEKDRKDIKRSNEQRAKDWRVMWNDMLTTARRAANDIEKQIRDMRVNGTNTFRRLRSDWSKVWGDAWQNIADFTYTALQYAGHEANLALKAFGAKTLTFGLRTKDIKSGKASGGWIGEPGERGRDMVPTWLGRGEAVLNWAHQRYIAPAVEAYYGHPFAKTFDRVRGFHAGGSGDAVGFAQGGLTGPQGSGAAFTAIANFAKQKFGLSMTAGRTDHNYTTSTGNVSDHSWGGAGDFSNGVNTPQENAFNNFWLTKAPQAIKQLIWQGKDQQRGFPISDHFDHVHLAVSRALAFDLPRMAKIISRASRGLDIRELMAGVTGTDGTPVVDHVDKINIKGAPWAVSLLKKLTDKVINAANSFIDDKAAKSVPSTGASSIPLAPGGAAEQVFSYFVDRGLSEVVAAGIAGAFQKESGFVTTVTNRLGSGATGLAQWLGPRLTALHSFGGDKWNTLQTQLDFVWHELTGSESGALAGVKRARTPEEAATIFDKLYERSDGLLSAPTYARAIFNAYERHRSHFAEGGVVGGGDGTPVPIVAHAGEWVLNKAQQARAAALAGLSPSGLSSLLGFWGGGKMGYAGGTSDVEKVELATGPLTGFKIKPLIDAQLQDSFKELRRLTDKLAKDLRTGSVGKFISNLNQTLDDLKDASDKMRGVNRADRRRSVDGFIKVFANLFGESGLFARLRTEIEKRQAAAARALTRGRFAVGADRHVTEREDAAVFQTRGELTEARRLQGDLLGEQSAAAEALRRVRRQQRRGGLTQEQRQTLAGQAAQAQTLLTEAQQRVTDNIQAIYEAQQAYLAAQLDAQNEAVDKITTAYERGSKTADNAKRIADALGSYIDNEPMIAAIAQGDRDRISNYADQLEARIAGFRAIGTDEANKRADDIADQVADLRTQVIEMIAQELRDSVDRISQRATRRLGALDLAGRMLDATGVVGQTVAGAGGLSRQGIFAARGTALTDQRTALGGVLGQAQATGNLRLIQELTDQIADLDVTIAENTKAAFAARVEDVNTRSGYALTMNDLNRQVLELTGSIDGNTDQAGLLKLAQDRQAILVQKGNDLQQLYNDAVAADDQQAMLDLQQAMLENRVAMLQNTLSINELNGVMKDPQSFTSSAWSQFREAIFTGMGQVLPQYDPSMMGGSVTGNIGGGGGVGSSWSNNSTKGDTNINFEINEAGGPIDIGAVSSAVSFASKTAQ